MASLGGTIKVFGSRRNSGDPLTRTRGRRPVRVRRRGMGEVDGHARQAPPGPAGPGQGVHPGRSAVRVAGSHRGRYGGHRRGRARRGERILGQGHHLGQGTIRHAAHLPVRRAAEGPEPGAHPVHDGSRAEGRGDGDGWRHVHDHRDRQGRGVEDRHRGHHGVDAHTSAAAVRGGVRRGRPGRPVLRPARRAGDHPARLRPQRGWLLFPEGRRRGRAQAGRRGGRNLRPGRLDGHQPQPSRGGGDRLPRRQADPLLRDHRHGEVGSSGAASAAVGVRVQGVRSGQRRPHGDRQRRERPGGSRVRLRR